LPSVAWVTAVAARLVWCAIKEVLSGTWDQWFDLASDAKSVFEGFDSGEGPASAALSLVSDGTDARWPLGSGVEGGGECGAGLEQTSLDGRGADGDGACLGGSGWLHTTLELIWWVLGETLLELAEGAVLEVGWDGCLPGSLGRVDSVHFVLGHQVFVIVGNDVDGSDNTGE